VTRLAVVVGSDIDAALAGLATAKPAGGWKWGIARLGPAVPLVEPEA
jgi:hypothetical protein